MNAPKHPLTPEERALAQRLQAELDDAAPSQALDAGILAAARDAVRADAPAALPAHGRSSRPRRRRWGAPVGLAASLALAVGMAWQLREPPRPELADARQAAAGPAADAETVVQFMHEAPVTEAAPAPAMPDVAPPPAPQSAAPRSDPSSGSAAPAGAARRARPTAATAAPAQEPAPAQQELFRQRVEARAPIAPAADNPRQDHALPAPPPPPMPVMASPSTPMPDEHADRFDAAPPQAARMAARPAVVPPQDPAPASAPAAMSSLALPEAAADADIDIWLERIRAQRDRGELDAARASLERFISAHPQHPLPEDLRRLR